MADEKVTLPGPSEEQLASLKKQYKKIYRIVWYNQSVYYVRELTRQEYRKIRQSVAELPEEEAGQRGDEMIVQIVFLTESGAVALRIEHIRIGPIGDQFHPARAACGDVFNETG